VNLTSALLHINLILCDTCNPQGYFDPLVFSGDGMVTLGDGSVLTLGDGDAVISGRGSVN